MQGPARRAARNVGVFSCNSQSSRSLSVSVYVEQATRRAQKMADRPLGTCFSEH